MERLTKTYSDGTYAAADDLPCGENSYDFKALLISALGEFEDTGLEPEEIRALKDKGGWISVGERLPEAEETILISVPANRGISHGYGSVDISYLRNSENNKFYATDKEYNLEDVIAWHPIPEPNRSRE